MKQQDESSKPCMEWTNHPAVARALRQSLCEPYIFTVTPNSVKDTHAVRTACDGTGSDAPPTDSHLTSVSHAATMTTTLREGGWRATPRAAPSLYTHASLASTVHLCASTFPGRRATLYLRAYDRPWDGCVTCNDTAHSYVQLSALPSHSDNLCEGAAEHANTTHRNDGCVGRTLHCESATAEPKHRQHKPLQLLSLPRRSDGPYRDLCYRLSADAVPFSALLCTLAAAGFRPARTRAEETRCSLSWVARPVPSDFVKTRPRQRQKLNHIPGAWRLGKKDALHRALCEQVGGTVHTRHEGCTHEYSHADASYNAGNDITQSDDYCASKDSSSSSSNNDANSTSNNNGEEMSSVNSDGEMCSREKTHHADLRPCRWFPEGWVLPEEHVEAQAAMRASPAHARFILKPTTSACGRGIALLRGGADAKLVLPTAAPRVTAQRACSLGSVLRSGGATRWVLQRYVENVYLIHGYKWDLRLYVLVTSYAPVRLYLYTEGLVRFATAPYPAASAVDTGSDAAEHARHRDSRVSPMCSCSLEQGDECVGSRSNRATATTGGNSSNGRCGADPVGEQDECLHSTRHDDKNKTSNTDNNDDNSNDSNKKDSSDTCMRAHLTNFTINKTAAAAEAEVGSVPKWNLAALRAHMTQDGWDWEATMTHIRDVLCRVFLSVAANVRRELESVDRSHLDDSRDGHASVEADSEERPSRLVDSSRRPPCTFRGVSPFFQLYGVDMLLCRPCRTTGAASSPAALEPVIMEVNIMPSLSTHYSLLDQHIKGNFIADALTVVGLSTPTLRPSAATRLAAPRETNDARGAVRHLGSDVSCAVDSVSYGDDFLDALRDVDDLEACLTAEEERLRAPRFDRLLPTATSDVRYAAQLPAGGEVGVEKSRRWSYHCLDGVLSAWERSRQKVPL